MLALPFGKVNVSAKIANGGHDLRRGATERAIILRLFGTGHLVLRSTSNRALQMVQRSEVMMMRLTFPHDGDCVQRS